MADGAAHGEHRIAGPRLIAIVGPFQSGKTSLLEAMLARGGGAPRQGSVREGTSIGDSSPEARAHADERRAQRRPCRLYGRPLHFFRLPGFGRVLHDMRAGAAGLRRGGGGLRGRPPQDARAAADPARARGDARPAAFVPQQDRPRHRRRARDAGRCCSRPRARRCCCARFPVWQHGVATGFIDLALERAFRLSRARALRGRRNARRRRAR